MRLNFPLFSVAILFSFCSQKKESTQEVKPIEKQILLSETVEAEGPPGPNEKDSGEFRSITEWLSKICKTERPEKQISFYEIGLFECYNTYTLSLGGMNESESATSTSAKIAFEPKYKFYFLPGNRYNGTRDKILSLITSELKSFSQTETFKRSFFTEAKSVKTDFAGIIWANK
jgi:hypothetical protein